METVQTTAPHEGACLEREMEFTSTYRWQHWVRALSIVILTVTGFYIASPFVTPIPNAEPTNFMQALFRSWHEIFGFVLMAVVLFKAYLFIFICCFTIWTVLCGDLYASKNGIPKKYIYAVCIYVLGTTNILYVLCS